MFGRLSWTVAGAFIFTLTNGVEDNDAADLVDGHII